MEISNKYIVLEFRIFSVTFDCFVFRHEFRRYFMNITCNEYLPKPIASPIQFPGKN